MLALTNWAAVRAYTDASVLTWVVFLASVRGIVDADFLRTNVILLTQPSQTKFSFK